MVKKMREDLKGKSLIDAHKFFKNGPNMQLQASLEATPIYYDENVKIQGKTNMRHSTGILHSFC